MDKIIGNTVGVPNPKSDLAQTDATKADYVKNKKTSLLENDAGYLTEKDIEYLRTQADNNSDNITENQKHITELYAQLDNRVHVRDFEEFQSDVGDTIHLETEVKEDLVSAINELHHRSMAMEVKFIPENDSGVVYKINELQAQMGEVETALDGIIAIQDNLITAQNNLIRGDAE